MTGIKSLVQVTPDSTGKKIDTRQLDNGDGNIVQRQAVCIGDPETVDNTLTITPTGAAKVDGSGVTLSTNEKYTFTSISESGVIKAGAGTLGGILCTSSSSGTIKIYDSPSATGTVIINTMPVTAGTPYPIPVVFTNGCYITINGTVTLTVFYN